MSTTSATPSPAPAGEDAYSGPDSRLALDEMASSMGFVVAKKGGAPDGSRVELALTGPLARTIRVAVDGRGAVVPDFAGEQPTASITLDGRQFVRLPADGRWSGTPRGTSSTAGTRRWAPGLWRTRPTSSERHRRDVPRASRRLSFGVRPSSYLQEGEHGGKNKISVTIDQA